ncbi:hypothetical protein VTO42DRAFT_6357 [Malbranchea cinnamomea]
MRPTSLKNGFLRVPSILQRRWFSSPASIALDELHAHLTSRRLPLIYDYLSPQPSHLLNISLSEFLPRTTSAPATSEEPAAVSLPSITAPGYMPIAHHLVYFPPQVPSSQLLPDGTDVLHSPGSPFNRRMWAGGSARFFQNGGPLLNGKRAVCMEGIRDVTVKGKDGDEKIFVGVERRVATVDEGEDEENIRKRVWAEKEEDPGDAVVVERRNLVFMRDKTPEQIQADREKPAKVVKAPVDPEFSHTLVPSRALLFRYSALTFNAHSIHLDRYYAQNVEGYNDLLVHGPLTLTLILTLAQGYLSQLGKAVSSIEYRNLAPLLVERPMTVCAKPKQAGQRDAWDIWVERSDRGLAVRGTIETKPSKT